MGSNPTRNNFLRFLKQNITKGKNCEKVGEISEIIGKSREKSDKRNFCAFFFSRLTEKRYLGEISAEKTEIFVHGCDIYVSLLRPNYIVGELL